MRKKVISDSELYFFTNSRFPSGGLTIFIAFLVYLVIVITNTQPLPSGTFSLITVVQFFLILLIIFSFIGVFLRYGFVITPSEIIYYNYFFSHHLTKKIYKKSDFVVFITSKKKNNVFRNVILLTSGYKKFPIYKYVGPINEKVMDVISLLQKYGCQLNPDLSRYLESLNKPNSFQDQNNSF